MKKIIYYTLCVSILYFLLWCLAAVQDRTRRSHFGFQKGVRRKWPVVIALFWCLNYGIKPKVVDGFCLCCCCLWFYFVLFAGLFPAVLNLATNALITTNATCGEKGREMYCKLVEHVPGQPARNPQCRICDLRSRLPHRTWAAFILFL